MIIRKIAKFFDKLEDKIRAVLSRHVIIYALVGGVGIVLFWRGVWKIADDLHMNGLFSIIASSVLLLMSGLFVSFFIADRIILSGLKGEKKMAEKTEEEIKTDVEMTAKVLAKLEKIEKDMEEIKSKLTNN